MPEETLNGISIRILECLIGNIDSCLLHRVEECTAWGFSSPCLAIHGTKLPHLDLLTFSLWPPFLSQAT
jgi:hypothetical protein